MKRVVLDTNVLVSAALIPGSVPARLLDGILERASGIVLLTSPPLLLELEGILRLERFSRYFADQELEAIEFTGRIRRFSICTRGELQVRRAVEDPADDMVLSCAIEGRADLIVSGDRHLLALGTQDSIQIVTPRRAYEKLINQS